MLALTCGMCVAVSGVKLPSPSLRYSWLCDCQVVPSTMSMSSSPSTSRSLIARPFALNPLPNTWSLMSVVLTPASL